MENENKQIIRCNMCEWKGYEDQLIIVAETPQEYDRNFFRGCPICKKDDYLMDVTEEQISKI